MKEDYCKKFFLLVLITANHGSGSIVNKNIASIGETRLDPWRRRCLVKLTEL